MKKILLTITALFGLHAQSTHAASVGPYIIDQAATASSVTSLNAMAGTNGLSSITDFDLTTYVLGNPVGTIGLGFENALFNQSGDDLAFYFIRASDDTGPVDFGLSINGANNSYEASLATYFDSTDGLTKKYQVKFGTGFADMFIATVELGDFGITGTDFINDMALSDLDSTDRFALAAGFNLTAEAPVVVPVPAAAWLFMTGLVSLGFVSRRKS